MRLGMMLRHWRGKRDLLSRIGKIRWSLIRCPDSGSERRRREDLIFLPMAKWKELPQQLRLRKLTKVVQLLPGIRFSILPLKMSISKNKFKNWPKRNTIKNWRGKESMLILGKLSWRSFHSLPRKTHWSKLFTPPDQTELPSQRFHKVRFLWPPELFHLLQGPKLQISPQKVQEMLQSHLKRQWASHHPPREKSELEDSPS